MMLLSMFNKVKVPSIEQLLNRNEVYTVTLVLLVLYITYSSVSPNQHAVKVISNDIGRLLILLAIVYVSLIKLEIGALMAFAYLVTLYNDKNINDE